MKLKERQRHRSFSFTQPVFDGSQQRSIDLGRSPVSDQITSDSKNPLIFRSLLLIAGDVLAFLISILGSYLGAEIFRYYFNIKSVPTDPSYFSVPIALSICILLTCSAAKGHYSRFKPYWKEVKELIKIILIIVLACTATMFVLKSHLSRFWMLFFWIFLAISIPVSRLVVCNLASRFGKWMVPTVIISSSKYVKKIASTMHSDSYMGSIVVQTIPINEDRSMARIDELYNYLRRKKASPLLSLERYRIPSIVFSLDGMADDPEYLKAFERLVSVCNYVTVSPPDLGLPALDAEVLSIFKSDTVLLRFQNRLNNPYAKIAKRVFDIFVSLMLLPVAFLIYLVVGVLISLDGGPVFFKQLRIGTHGERFYCLKFRTMKVNADAILKQLLEQNIEAQDEWTETHKLRVDPRVTSLGRILRTFSIDELPQLINVLMGSMSLVGPRPIVEDEIGHYGDNFNYYESVKPGITGLWQVSGRSDTSYSERVDLDIWYVRNWSLWNDFVILMKTFSVLSNRQGAY